jgi:hypothetical protein
MKRRLALQSRSFVHRAILNVRLAVDKGVGHVSLLSHLKGQDR